jgi:hypothetical protein
MIDTLKIGIPLTQKQFTKIQQQVIQDEQWQWIKLQPSTGELKFVRYKGLANLDQQSFHRDLLWDIPDQYRENETYIYMEFSVPKFWYGHNIHLLYDFITPLKLLKQILEKQLHCRFVDVLQWTLWRVDICYAWRCHTQVIAQQILDSLKRLHYPRKKPTIYENSVLFTGATYSLKFYLKLPEFLSHDLKVLVKQKVLLEYINSLEKKAIGVLRCEATLRRKYLKVNNILTIKDLTTVVNIITLDDETLENHPEIAKSKAVKEACMMPIKGMIYLDLDELGKIKRINTEDSKVFTWEPNQFHLIGETYNILPFNTGVYGENYFFKGGSCSIKCVDKTVDIINYFLTKFLGHYKGMDDFEKVKAKLLEKYKSVKAARLLGFWLFVKEVGTYQVKKICGDNSYYVSKRDLKAAGISLVEPIKVIDAKDRFLKEFRLEIPSPYVTNTVDDYRDVDNILNLFQQQPNEESK